MYTRRTKCCQKYKCQYIELRGCLGNIPVMIYLIKYGRRQTWNIMLSTNLLMNFVRAFELYQIRWNIEVVNKETKEHLGLGSYMGCDFNGQIANATLYYFTNTVMALEKRSQNTKPWANTSRIRRSTSWRSRYGSEFLPASNTFFVF